jgi:HlyD family secretion protein
MSGMDRKIEKRNWGPKRLVYVAGALLVACVLIYILFFAGFGSRLNVNSERITTFTVERGEFQEFTPVTGRVIPVRTHFLDAVEGGRVDTVYVEAGTFIHRGDKLLKLTNTNLLLDIMYREAELFQQSNNLRNTKLALAASRLEMKNQLLDLRHKIGKQKRQVEDNAELAEKNLISARNHEDAVVELEYLRDKHELTLETQKQDSLYRAVQIEQLETSLDRMEANLEVVRQNLDNLVIRAPVSGHLTSLNAEVGESKSRGERLGQIDVLDGFKVRAAIDEHYIARVEVGQHGSFALSGDQYGLTVLKVYPEVVNSRFEVDLVFEGPEPEGIRRGQTLRIRLELGELSEATLLATGAFYQATGGRWAYVIDESGDSAEKRGIQLGRVNADFYEVLGGLEPGERVITSSYDAFGDVDQLVLGK